MYNDKRIGTIIYDFTQDRYDIQFNSKEYFGGLHCGQTFEVLINSEWKPTRIEFGTNDWCLVNIKTDSIYGLKARI